MAWVAAEGLGRRKRGGTPCLKRIKEGNLFPLRFLGFGFFWAWLFLTAISPSPLFGLAVCVGSIAFEMLELGVRTILLLGVLGLFKRLATPAGCRLLLAASLVCGVVRPVPCGLLGTPRASTVAAVLVAVADVGMFLLWLSFFGYMRLGEHPRRSWCAPMGSAPCSS